MIDFHYHYSSYSYNSWSPSNSVRDILHEMEKLEIDKRFVFPYFNPAGYAYSQANNEIISTCQKAPSQLLPVLRARFPVDITHELKNKFWSLNAEYGNSSSILNIAGAMRYMRNKLSRSPSINDLAYPQFVKQIPASISALKFHNEEDGSLNSKRFLKIQEIFNLLIIHMDPFDLELLLRSPGKKDNFIIILAHFGSFELLPWQIAKALELTKKYKNVYVDCSAVFAKTMIQSYLPLFGDKVVFGSDGPCFSTRVTIELLKEVDLLDQVVNNSHNLAEKILRM